MDWRIQGKEKIRFKYLVLLDEKKKREKELENLQEEIKNLDRQLSEMKWLVDPHVSISKITSKSQKDRYIGKFMVYLDNGKSKQVSVSLGSTDKYSGVKDPVLINYSKEKAMDYLINHFPEKYK